jgi:hypothetical protein
MTILIKRLGHEKHKLLLIEIIVLNDLCDHLTNQTSNKKDRGLSR